MTLDQHARSSAAAVREQLDAIEVPEPRALVRRANRRRTTRVLALATLVAVGVATVFITRDDESEKIRIVNPPELSGAWTDADKSTSGIGAGASLHVLETVGSTYVLGGERPAAGGYRVTMWWSTDGLSWHESQHPEAHDSITAVATHDGTALAVGAPGGSNAFVWRSNDDGRTWDRVAEGALFGEPEPNNRPGAFVTNLTWYGGWWVASGGAAPGYEGIWISRDGAQWQLVLDSRTSGGIEDVIETIDGLLMAYGAGPEDRQVAWFTSDPTVWGDHAPVNVPDGIMLSTIAPGVELAIGTDNAPYNPRTRLLGSNGEGRVWTEMESFNAQFSDTSAWVLTTVGDAFVMSGTKLGTNGPGVWVSLDGDEWTEFAPAFDPASLPSTSVPRVPPDGAFDLAAAVGNRVVIMGTAPNLDRIGVLDLPRTSG